VLDLNEIKKKNTSKAIKKRAVAKKQTKKMREFWGDFEFDDI
jgi:hypothetical protein